MGVCAYKRVKYSVWPLERFPSCVSGCCHQAFHGAVTAGRSSPWGRMEPLEWQLCCAAWFPRPLQALTPEAIRGACVCVCYMEGGGGVMLSPRIGQFFTLKDKAEMKWGQSCFGGHGRSDQEHPSSFFFSLPLFFDSYSPPTFSFLFFLLTCRHTLVSCCYKMHFQAPPYYIAWILTAEPTDSFVLIPGWTLT